MLKRYLLSRINNYFTSWDIKSNKINKELFNSIFKSINFTKMKKIEDFYKKRTLLKKLKNLDWLDSYNNNENKLIKIDIDEATLAEYDLPEIQSYYNVFLVSKEFHIIYNDYTYKIFNSNGNKIFHFDVKDRNYSHTEFFHTEVDGVDYIRMINFQNEYVLYITLTIRIAMRVQVSERYLKHEEVPELLFSLKCSKVTYDDVYDCYCITKCVESDESDDKINRRMIQMYHSNWPNFNANKEILRTLHKHNNSYFSMHIVKDNKIFIIEMEEKHKSVWNFDYYKEFIKKGKNNDLLYNPLCFSEYKIMKIKRIRTDAKYISNIKRILWHENNLFLVYQHSTVEKYTFTQGKTEVERLVFEGRTGDALICYEMLLIGTDNGLLVIDINTMELITHLYKNCLIRKIKFDKSTLLFDKFIK